jgi:DNA-binding IclR family transcriptional regulator
MTTAISAPEAPQVLAAMNHSGGRYLYVANIVRATGLSEHRVRAALEHLTAGGFVKKSQSRNSRGYSYNVVSEAERQEKADRKALVDALTEALESATGQTRGINVFATTTGLVRLDLSDDVAGALVDVINAFLAS